MSDLNKNEAIDIVVDLARQNIPEEEDVPDQMKKEIDKYHHACDIVDDLKD